MSYNIYIYIYIYKILNADLVKANIIHYDGLVASIRHSSSYKCLHVNNVTHE